MQKTETETKTPLLVISGIKIFFLNLNSQQLQIQNLATEMFSEILISCLNERVMQNTQGQTYNENVIYQKSQ